MQFVDLLALAGDAADNVPGVKGVGFKTAPLLIRKHGDVEGVLASAHEGEKAVCASCSETVMHISPGCIVRHPLLVCTSSGMSLSNAQLWMLCCTCLRVLLGMTPLGITPFSCFYCDWQVSVQCKMLSYSLYFIMSEHCTWAVGVQAVCGNSMICCNMSKNIMYSRHYRLWSHDVLAQLQFSQKSYKVLLVTLQHVHTSCQPCALCNMQGIRAKLTAPEAAPAARLSKKLVTIRTDVDLPPIRFPMDTLALESPSDMTQQATKAAFAHLDFKQHEKRLESIWNNMRQDPQGVSRVDAPVWHSAVRPASELVQS